MSNLDVKIADVLDKGGYLKSFAYTNGEISYQVSPRKIADDEMEHIRVNVASADEVLVDIDMDVPHELVLQVLYTIMTNIPEPTAANLTPTNGDTKDE